MSDPVTRLNAALEGRYAIERELGEGGMATVYLADDLTHERKVALKVLKPELAAVVGAERFLAEIKTTTKLQHPHILPLFDSGEADTFLFYVMPYVDGETLRDRIDREKQLPVDEAVRIATAVANALDHAHRHNVIHRDIKPGNILLQDGEPIVADFGIALAVGAAGSNRLTETGLSLGTPFYMSPEQATGDRAVGASTDTYALGAVLYEMLVGEPPYPGTTAQAVLGKIIAGKPVSATEQRPSIPANVDAALRRALEKLPADRFSSAQEFVRALGDTGFRYGEVVAAGDASAAVSSWNRLTVSMTGLAALSTVLAVVFGWVVLRPQSGDIEPIRFVAQLPDSLELLNPYLSFTPDGTRMVMPGGNGPVLRALGDVGAYVIDIGKRAGAPFLSPDGSWVAFVDGQTQQLEKVSFNGGASIPIVRDISIYFGGTWGPGDSIIYSPELSEGLWQVSAEGGASRQLTAPPGRELGHWWPQFLPGGKQVLFNVFRTPIDSATIEVLDLETLERTQLVRGGQYGRYVSTGHLVFMYYESMYAVPFDLSRLTVTGPRVPVLTDVVYDAVNARGGFAISENGTLAYFKQSSWDAGSRLVWVDRDGVGTPLMNEWNRYARPAILRNGEHVAYVLDSQEGDPDIWVYDAERATTTRLTQRAGWVSRPLWTQDGTRVIYEGEDGSFQLFWRDWQASAPEEPLLVNEVDDRPWAISPDGRVLAFSRLSATTGRDIWTMRLDGQPEPFRDTGANETHPAFSPDERWMAYVSEESGRDEIWLESYPDAARGRYRISTEGGRGPLWAPDGELFFNNDDQMMSVQVDLAMGASGVPTPLFQGSYRFGPARNYDVSADGRRFLMVEPRRPGEERREVVVVLNWSKS